MMVWFRTAWLAVACIGVSAACGHEFDSSEYDEYDDESWDEQWEGDVQPSVPLSVTLHDSRLEGPLGILPWGDHQPNLASITQTDYSLGLYVEREGEDGDLGMLWISTPHARTAEDTRIYTSLSEEAAAEPDFRRKAAAYGVSIGDDERVLQDQWDAPFSCSGKNGSFVDEVPSEDWVVRVSPCDECEQGYDIDFWMWSNLEDTRRDISGHFVAHDRR